MKKRSALLVAAGLVLTLIVGGLAVAVGLTGPSVSTAVPRVDRRATSEPIVRTVRRKVTVHKKAEAKPGEVVQIAAPATATTSSNDLSQSSGDDPSFGDDESHESSEHEDEDHGNEDHSEDHGDDD